MNTFLDYAPNLGLACLIVNSVIAAVFFFKLRLQRKVSRSLRARNDALAVDNVGLRAQNARLMQRLARLLQGVGNVAQAIRKFDPAKEEKNEAQ